MGSVEDEEELANALSLDYVISPAEGASGGLMSMWNPAVFQVNRSWKEDRAIILDLRCDYLRARTFSFG